MAFSDDDPPFAAADLDRHPVGKALEARGHRGNAAAVALFPIPEQLARRPVEAGAMREVAAQCCEILGAAAHHPSHRAIPSR
jgi:hypothetical protein